MNTSPTRPPETRIERLEMQHRELKRRVAAMSRHRFLTPAEYLELGRLKKQKLATKDELAALREQLQSVA